MSREMKQSGVPWLKDIPSEWKVERGKNVLVLLKRPVRDNDEVVTCFRDGEVILRSLRRTEGFTMSDKEIGYQGINEGDIVIHGMDGFAGAMGVSKSTGKGSPVLVVCSPKYDADPQYLIYYLRALAMTDVFIALATGIRERSCDLRWNKISELEFILPSAKEQQKIASFLDRKCAEIDEMIALQEKIVEELKAYKQSVITEAVTKGLNPDVPMKDSGIEWIGEIPEHWEVVRLKGVATVQRGGSPRPIEEYLSDEGYNWIKIGDTIKGDKYIRSVKQKIKESGVSKSRKVYKGDLILTNSMSFGEPYILQVDGCIHDGWVAFSNISKVDKEFLYYFFFSSLCKLQFNLQVAGGVVQNLNVDKISSTLIVLPPEIEQSEIVTYLDTKCTEIDNLISIKLSKIDSLKEYKKSIIYEYVTGKKEVTE